MHNWQGGTLIGGVLLGLGAIALSNSTAMAQITPDETLGAERSIINRGVTVRGRLGDRVDGGATRGVNLFHSFQEFNVNEGQRVYFNNPTGIENILSRITGNDVSDIMGTLGVDGVANLFLLNPNGILFGPNARLDIGGSFTASTGDRFTFSDGSDFSATNPQAPPLLTMRVPIGLQYGTGNISNQGQLATGQDLTLSGNSLNLQGQLQAGRNLTLQAQDTVQIRDSITTPFIARAGDELLVQGDRTVDIFTLNHPNSGFFSGGNLTLRSASPVSGDAHYWSGGNFRIEQLDGTLGDLISPYDPIILAIGDVVLGDVLNTASLHILAGGSVTLGNVEVTSIGTANNTINPANPDPFLAALATVGIPTSVNSGVPDAPREGIVDGSTRFFVDIRAGVDWSLIPGFPGNTVIDAPTPPPAGATTADIRVGAIDFTGSVLGGVVYLTNQYQPNALTAPNGIVVDSINTGGEEGGGSVTVDARSGITLNGTVITSALDSGSSGDVNFRAVGNIALNPGSRIDSSSVNSNPDIPFSTVRLESTNGSVSLNNARIFATNSGTRFAGDVYIDARDRIEITNNSEIVAEGNLGQIFIGSSSSLGDDSTAPTTVVINSSALETSNQPITDPTTSFNAGDINVRSTGLISITGSSSINASTYRLGNAGDVNLEAGTGEIRIEGPDILSTVESGATGDAGTIDITGGSLFLTNNTQLQTLVRGGAQGNANDVDIELTGVFSADNGQIFSTIEADGGTGNSGNVLIQAGAVDFRNNSSVQAQNNSTGFAGDISVTSGSQISIANSFIQANSDNNNGTVDPDSYSEIRLDALTGSVVLTGATVTTTNSGIGTDTTTDADNGIAGNVIINARDRVVIQDKSTVASRGRLGRILIGNTLASESVEILNNPEDTEDQYGLIADGFAGRVEITAGDRLQISNSRITSRSNNNSEDSNTFGRISFTAQTGSVFLENGTLLSSTNFGTGFAGDINVNARDRIVITGESSVLSQGQFGRIFIGAGSDDIAPPQQTLIRGNVLISTDNGFVNDSTEQAGDISISGRDRVDIINSRITSRSRNETDNFSEIRVTATDGSAFLNSAELSTTNAAEGLAGDITITAPDLISVTNQSEITSEGNFGRILIGNDASRNTVPNRIRVSNTRLSTSNQIDDDRIDEDGDVFGRAGNIQLIARQQVDIANPVPVAGVRPSRFSILSETVGDESAGNITFTARRGAVNMRGGFTSTRTGIGVLGDGGSITVQGRSVDIRGGAQISTSTFGFGNSGDVTFTSNQITLDNAQVFSTIEAGAGTLGNPVEGGSISVTGRSLTMSNGAQLQTQVNGSIPSSGSPGGIGTAGTVTLNIRNLISLEGRGTSIFSNVDSGAIGNGGFISLITRNLSMSNGAQLQTQVNGIDTAGTRRPGDDRPGAIGDAGDVFVGVSSNVALDGGGTAIFSSIGSGATGDGGDIFVGDLRRLRNGAIVVRPTRSFAATNGAQLIASSAGDGDAGSVSILSRDIIFDDVFESEDSIFPSAVFSGIEEGGTGQGGDIFVGGGIVLNANGSVRSARPANSLILSNSGLITVSTAGQGDLTGDELTPTRFRAGNVVVLADIMRLQNNGRIVARTGRGDGGNIISGTTDGLLLMSGASRISTTAGTERQPGDGGNINITIGSGFAIAEPLGNNDISADAFLDRGGRVEVDAEGIISFVNRSREDVQRLLGEDAFNQIDPTSQLQTNDITAISQSDASLNGVVDINATDFDTRAIANLPVDLGDASQLIARNCPSEGEEELGEFVVTGRGGLPANPNEILGSEDVLTDWVEPTNTEAPTNPSEVGEPQSNLEAPIVEAQQWMMNPNGEVVLVATNPDHAPVLNPAMCNAREANAREANARETSVTQH